MKFVSKTKISKKVIVSTGLSAQLNQHPQTLEQFFELPIHTAYPAQSLIL